MLNTIHKDYKYTGISGVDSTTEILHGRPKGGAAILFKKSLAKYVSYIKSNDRRICAIKLCMENNFSCMVTNVYLPCDNFSNTVVSDGFIDCINCIESMLALANCDSFILCGDFNSSFQRANAQSNCLQQFIDRNNLLTESLAACH